MNYPPLIEIEGLTTGPALQSHSLPFPPPSTNAFSCLPTTQAAIKASQKDWEVIYDPHSRVPRAKRPGEAVVRVMAAGLCGSDIHSYVGKEKGLRGGTIRGHELCGVVVEVNDVVGVEVGDRVVAPFSTCCGKCGECRRGLTARCPLAQLFGWREEKGEGVGEEEEEDEEEELRGRSEGLHGAQAEYVVVPLASSSLVRLTDDISFEEGMLCGDILATGYCCAANGNLHLPVSNIRKPNWPSPFQDAKGKGEGEGEEEEEEPLNVLLIGCGPVGMMALVSAVFLLQKNNTKYNLFAADMVPSRLALAERVGATPILIKKNTQENQKEEKEKEKGKEREKEKEKESPKLPEGKIDVVLEAVGSASALQLAYRTLHPGGVISSVGVHTSPFPFTPNDLYDKNAVVRFGRCSARGIAPLLPEVLLFARNTLKFDLISEVVTHIEPLEKGPQMYREFAERKEGVVKVIFRPQPNPEELIKRNWKARLHISPPSSPPDFSLSPEWLENIWTTPQPPPSSLPLSSTQLTHLTLSGLSLTSITPSFFSLSSLSSLTTLSLDHNSLVSLPPSLTTLVSLRYLALHSNSLTHIPSSISNLTSLLSLRLDDNNLSLLPLSLSSLSLLKTLHLGGNSITNTYEVVKEMGGLRDLMLGEGKEGGVEEEREEERDKISECLPNCLVYCC